MGGYRRPWPSSGQATFGGSQIGSKLRVTGADGASPFPTMEAAEDWAGGCWDMGDFRKPKVGEER